MFKNDGTTIFVTRGDTARFLLEIYQGNTEERYYPQSGDEIRFAVKKKYKDDDVVIYKIIPNETLELEILPEDTENLSFGSYVYDIQITKENGDVDTFIDRACLKITEEVD